MCDGFIHNFRVVVFLWGVGLSVSFLVNLCFCAGWTVSIH